MKYIKRPLKSLLSWLESRFPERIEVTLDEYNSLFETLGQMNKKLQEIDKLSAALKLHDQQISNISMNLGFSMTAKGVSGGLER